MAVKSKYYTGEVPRNGPAFDRICTRKKKLGLLQAELAHRKYIYSGEGP